jgi:hypothetical protein
MNSLILMTVEWKVEADHVAVTYRVANSSAEPVYLIDGSFHGPGGAVAWSDRLKVGFRPPETAVLGSRLVPLNPLVHSTYSPATFAVRLGAGETHESTLTAPLPLVPDGMTTQPVPQAVVIGGKLVPPPFAGEPPQLADRPIVCRAATFELGVIPHDETLCAQPARLANRNVFRLEKAAWSLQRIVSAERRVIEMPMRVPAAIVEKAR